MRKKLTNLSQRREKRVRRFRSLVAERLEDRTLLAVTAQLAVDINQGAKLNVSGPFVDVGGVAYFAADDGVSGLELWRSDGTSSGTFMVKDIALGVAASSPANLINANGTLYFAANDGVNGLELWKSDGTALGTVLVKDIYSGLTDANPQNLTVIGSSVFFSAADFNSGRELWKTDGTPNGTVLVKDIRPGIGSSYPGQYASLTNYFQPKQFANVNGTLFFSAANASNVNTADLWKSDGTAGGTVLVKAEVNPVELTNFNGNLFFVQYGTTVWRSDGTPDGTVTFRNAINGAIGAERIITHNGSIYFAHDSADYHLIRSDGTSAGAVLLTTTARNVTASGQFVFFTRQGELWKTDGTIAGTGFVKDVYPSGDDEVRELTNLNGTLFFTAKGDDARSLWKSDGTQSGTVVIDSLVPASVVIDSLAGVNGRLYMRVSSSIYSAAPAVSDGTSIVRLVPRNSQPNEGSRPRRFATINGIAYFMAADDVHGYEPWRSDGTPSGTWMIKDIHPGIGNSYSREFVANNGTIFFYATDENSWGLWRTDGTASGTTLVKRFPDGAGFQGPQNINGSLVFWANDFINGSEIWKSDGTPEGTVLVKDINPGPGSAGGYWGSSQLYSAVLNGTFLFLANDGTRFGLWKTDGTADGTTLLKDLGTQYPDLMGIVNGKLTFYADGRLWVTDGTTAGTYKVSDVVVPQPNGPGPAKLTAFNGVAYFSVGPDLWRTDLTEAGTALVKTGVYPAGVERAMVDVNGTLFISSWRYDTANRRYIAELWKSDGTPGGTVFVKRLAESSVDLETNPYGVCCRPQNLTNFSGRLFFTGGNETTGRELWTSDGTQAGTFMIQDIFPGPDHYNTPGDTRVGDDFFSEQSFTALNGNLYFAANDSIHGTELWMVQATNTTPTAQGKTITTSKDAAIGVLLVANDLDKGPQPLKYTIVNQPQQGVLSGTAPNLTYTPASGYVGPDSFTFQVFDGLATSNLATVSIAVAANNQAPVANGQLVTVAEDTSITITLTASDTESGVLAYSVVDSPLHGRLDGTAPNLTYTPNGNSHSSDRITFRASDGALESNLAVVLITVTPINDPPVAGGAVLLVRQSDGPKPVVFDATDVDGDPLTFSVITQPQYGRLIQQGDTLLYERPASPVLVDEFQYQASDGQSLSNIATFTVVNFDLIVFAEDGYQTFEGWAQKLFPDVPPGGSPDLVFKTTNDKSDLFSEQPTIDSTGTLTFTPAPNSKGTATVTVVKYVASASAFKVNSLGFEGEGGGDVDTEVVSFTIDVLQQFPLQNDLIAEDVNGDFSIAADDVLFIINYINSQKPYEVPPDAPPADPFIDVTGDNFVAPDDVVEVINYINAHPGETGPLEEASGEYAAATTLSPTRQNSLQDTLLLLIATDTAQQSKRRLL